MRKSVIIFLGIGLGLVVSAGVAGCGGGSSKAAVAATLTLAPASVSIDTGGVTTLVATVKDSAGVVLLRTTVTYSSSNTSVATVSTGGLVCGGTWDNLTTPVVCTPGSAGKVTITASGGGLTATSIVYVHQPITSITLSPGSVDCDSQKATTQFTAHAFNGATDITSTVGPFTWTSNDANVVTIVADTSNAAVLNVGTATAVNPGKTQVLATASSTSSVPSAFTTCPVASISAFVSPASTPPVTSFSVAVGSTKQLAATVVDSMGVTLSNVPLTWNSASPAVATVGTSALVGGVAPGQVGIVASCSPPTCNNGLNDPVYSNLVNGTVTGTAASQTVYVSSTQFNAACGTASSNTCTSLMPIPTSSNTVGSAIQLPSNQVPDSLAFDAGGANAYLGSSAGVMVFNAAQNSISGTVTNAVGKVLTVSPDGTRVLVADPGVGVTVFTPATSTVQGFNITDATGADFTPDSFKAYIVGGSTLNVYSPNFALRTVPLGGAGHDVNFLATGSFGYVAGGASPVQVYATCDNSLQGTVSPVAAPAFIRKVPGTLAMVAVDSPNVEIITASPTTPPPSTCPPTLTDSLVTVNTGVAFTPIQLLITPDGTKALITSNLAEVTEVDLGTHAVTHIALTGGAHAFTGGVTLDSKTLYVGASDGKVHVIDLGALTDSASPITITFPNQAAGVVPDLVTVRP